MSDLAAVVQSLTERVAKLEDQLEIAKLMASYGPAADAGNGVAAGRMFAEDGYFDAAPGLHFIGPAGIEEHIAGEIHQRNIANGSAHVLGVPIIQVDGDEAVATTHSQVLYRDEAAGGYRVGRVTSTRWEWKRTPHGWRVTSRIGRPLDGNAEAREVFAAAFE